MDELLVTLLLEPNKVHTYIHILIFSAFYLDSLFRFDKLDFANAFHEKRIAQVSDSEHEVVFSISDGDHCVVGEDQRVIFVLF